MSTFSNDLAPNLFRSYKDWEENYKKKTGHTPQLEDICYASGYFSGFMDGYDQACEENIADARRIINEKDSKKPWTRDD